MEGEKQYTPEEIAKLEKSRTISDADLLRGGAEYKVDEGGDKQLFLSEDQMDNYQKRIERNDWINMLKSLEKGKKIKITFGKIVSYSLGDANGYDHSYEGKEFIDVFKGYIGHYTGKFISTEAHRNIFLCDIAKVELVD